MEYIFTVPVAALAVVPVNIKNAHTRMLNTVTIEIIFFTELCFVMFFLSLKKPFDFVICMNVCLGVCRLTIWDYTT